MKLLKLLVRNQKKNSYSYISRGIKLGKPRGTKQRSILDKHKDDIKKWCRLGFPYSRQARVLNVSFTALYHYVKTRNIYCDSMLRAKSRRR